VREAAPGGQIGRKVRTMSLQSLHDQQRRTRNISRQWVNGYCSDDLMRRAALALAGAYEDAATWHVTSKALQTRYYNLARQYANQAKTIAREA